MALDPSEDGAPTRGRRGTTTTTTTTTTRRPRSASSHKGAVSRSSSRKPRGGRRSGGGVTTAAASSNRPVRQWVQVPRPPGNNNKIQFTVQQWIPLSDLTPAEREKYVPAGASSGTRTTAPRTGTDSSSLPAATDSYSFAGVVAARKLPPRPSSVTFALDTDPRSTSTKNEPSGDVSSLLPNAVESTTAAVVVIKAQEVSSSSAESGLTVHSQQPPLEQHVETEPLASVAMKEEDDGAANQPKRSASSPAATVEEPPAKRQRTTDDDSTGKAEDLVMEENDGEFGATISATTTEAVVDTTTDTTSAG